MADYVSPAQKQAGRSWFLASKVYFFTRVAMVVLVLITLLVSPPAARGQSEPITVSVNRVNFSTDELIILTVKVVDEDSPQQPRPILPPLDGLAVVDLDISTDVSVVAGKIRTEVIYTYRLQPRQTGLLVIPPVTVEIDGKTYRAAPISIQVKQGAPPVPSQGNAVQPADIAPPAGLAGQDFYIESQVDVSQPYIGQQVTYTFRFFQAIQLYRPPQYDAPLFTGFKTLGMPVQEYNLQIGDRVYLITEIQTALFPQTPGRVTIDRARLMFPGNFFEEPVELFTQPVTLNVQQLPGNAPADFNGAVGQYEIRAWFSPPGAVVDQPASYYVAVTGVGNIESLPEPTWPGLDGWRTYDSLSSLATEITEDRISGTRVYERLVVPAQEGNFTLPPATMVYFDPNTGEYKTISTEPVQVLVGPVPTPDAAAVTATAQALAATATPAAIASTDIAAPPEEKLVNPDLFDSSLSQWNIPLPFFAVLLLALCGMVPLAAAGGAGGVWLWHKQRAAVQRPPATEVTELLLPSQRIHPLLSETMKHSNDNFRTVSKTLYHYLEDILGYPVKGLARTELTQRLRQENLNQALVTRINHCLDESDVGSYGPATEDAGWTLMEKTETLLYDLDKALGRETKRG